MSNQTEPLSFWDFPMTGKLCDNKQHCFQVTMPAVYAFQVDSTTWKNDAAYINCAFY